MLETAVQIVLLWILCFISVLGNEREVIRWEMTKKKKKKKKVKQWQRNDMKQKINAFYRDVVGFW